MEQSWTLAERGAKVLRQPTSTVSMITVERQSGKYVFYHKFEIYLYFEFFPFLERRYQPIGTNGGNGV